MSLKEIISEARETLAKGWCKGLYSNVEETTYCAIGALNTAAAHANSFDEYKQAEKLLEEHLPGTFDDGPMGLRPLAAFNDAPETTKQDVLNVFDKALADLGGL